MASLVVFKNLVPHNTSVDTPILTFNTEDVDIVAIPRLLSLFHTSARFKGKSERSFYFNTAEDQQFAHVLSLPLGQYVVFISCAVTFGPQHHHDASALSAVRRLSHTVALCITNTLRMVYGDDLAAAANTETFFTLATYHLRSLANACVALPNNLNLVPLPVAISPSRPYFAPPSTVTELIEDVVSPFVPQRDETVAGPLHLSSLIALVVVYRGKVIYDLGRPEVVSPLYTMYAMSHTGEETVDSPVVETHPCHIPDAGLCAPLWDYEFLTSLTRLSVLDPAPKLKVSKDQVGSAFVQTVTPAACAVADSFTNPAPQTTPLEDVLDLIYTSPAAPDTLECGSMVSGRWGRVYISGVWAHNGPGGHDAALEERMHILLHRLIGGQTADALDAAFANASSSVAPLTRFIVNNLNTGHCLSTESLIPTAGPALMRYYLQVDPAPRPRTQPSGGLTGIGTHARRAHVEVREAGDHKDSVVTYGRCGECVVVGRATDGCSVDNVMELTAYGDGW